MDHMLADRVRDHIIYETYRLVTSFPGQQSPDTMAELYKAAFEYTKKETCMKLEMEAKLSDISCNPKLMMEYHVACHEAAEALDGLQSFDLYVESKSVSAFGIKIGTVN